jgi:DNA-binding NtrC family response regulator
LNVVAISLPPIRERQEDVPLLAYHFLQKYAARAGRDVHRISAEAMQILQSQPWPGNVRELENAIEYAIVFCRSDEIGPEALPMARVAQRAPGATRTSRDSGGLVLPGGLLDLPYRDAKQRAVDAFEVAYFDAVLRRAGGNVSEAARQAGLDRSNFRRAAKRSGLGGGAS